MLAKPSITAIIMLLAFITATALQPYGVVATAGIATRTADVYVNGNQVNFDPGAFISAAGHTMVPFTQVFELYQMHVEWDASTKRITASNSSTTIALTLDSKHATVNGQSFKLGQSPFINANVTYVNLRFISETLGATVVFKKAGKPMVYISKK